MISGWSTSPGFNGCAGAVAGLVRRLHYLLGADLWPSPNGKYRTHTKEFAVNSGAPQTLDFQLERWIDPAKYGWYSGDHHVHAAGCSHYMNPAEGVEPKDMIRQILGERLNVGSVLTWVPIIITKKNSFAPKMTRNPSPVALCTMIWKFPASHPATPAILSC